MITENVQCVFSGFDPEHETKTFIAQVADEIYHTAPSDSGIKLVIQKSRGLIKASCRIASQVGTFVAETSGKNPILAIQKLENEIKRQLDSWKMNRFRKV
jgi:ribosome-associated translation inhibitor RaiA